MGEVSTPEQSVEAVDVEEEVAIESAAADAPRPSGEPDVTPPGDGDKPAVNFHG